MTKFSLKLASSFLLLFLLSFPVLTFATNINSTAYAWSSKLGWVNFSPDTGNVTVTDTALTGYTWSKEAGWLNLAPDQSGIKNDKGTLSGSAWGQNMGWVNFSGVSINTSTGVFSGQAIGDIVGTLNFSCDQCHVVTTWRPYVAPISSGGGGGYISRPNQQVIATKSKTPLAPKLAPATITRTLSYKMTHTEVKLLQQFLNTHGFPVAKKGSGSLGHETTYFGIATKNAVIKFQMANKIKPASGLVGPLTRKVILKLL